MPSKGNFNEIEDKRDDMERIATPLPLPKQGRVYHPDITIRIPQNCKTEFLIRQISVSMAQQGCPAEEIREICEKIRSNPVNAIRQVKQYVNVILI